jgi:uncharacterized protein (UPF0179 family)
MKASGIRHRVLTVTASASVRCAVFDLEANAIQVQQVANAVVTHGVAGPRCTLGGDSPDAY